MADVLHDSTSFGKIHIAVNQIGQIWKVQPNRMLDIEPARFGAFRRWTLLVHLVLKVNIEVVEKVANGSGKPTNLPVGEDGFRHKINYQ